MTSLSLLLLAVPAFSQAVDRETLRLIGWNKACSAAIERLGYPEIGQAIADEPVFTRIGTVTIEPGEEKSKEKWLRSWDGRRSFQPEEAHDALAKLKKEGYVLPGFTETLRHKVAPERDLPRLVSSTESFRSKSPGPWPGPGWRFEKVYYSPLASTCALLVYKKEDEKKDFFKILLVRVGNPAIRFDRAVSRTTNARILQEKGALPDALQDAADAAGFAPEHSVARYHHAAILYLSGRIENAVTELEEAIKIDRGLRKKARQDGDFSGLSWHPRFRQAVGLPPEE